MRVFAGSLLHSTLLFSFAGRGIVQCLVAPSTRTSTSSPIATEQEQQLQESQEGKWTPKVSALEERRKLRGMKHESETIGSLGFHHVEFYCGDARMAANQFGSALGMSVVGMTGQSTGNDKCISYGLVSGNFRLLLTAPYSRAVNAVNTDDETADDTTTTTKDDGNNNSNSVEYDAPNPLPSFDIAQAHDFFQKHGLAARAVALHVKDAKTAFDESVKNGAQPILQPTFLPTCTGQVKQGTKTTGGCFVSEVQLYGDVVLRYVSYPEGNNEELLTDADTTMMPFLPHLTPIGEEQAPPKENFGIFKIDHAVGNVPNLLEAYSRVKKFTGFHEFAEFTTEDVGTLSSGLNSVVLASDSEDVLLPLNEPTEGTRKSQIQTYLEQNEGPGLQHLALKTSDIFSTVAKMRQAQASMFGLELMRRPSDEYYEELPSRIGDRLTPEQYEKLEELGILADADEEGILLQLFTKPIGDRPTFFFEIIQRIGCIQTDENTGIEMERSGCGGFGQGNFKELFKSIEDHEKTLKV